MTMAIDFLNVFYHQYNVTNFGALLFLLIAKADAENRASLEKGFPKEVALYNLWIKHNRGLDRNEIIRITEVLERADSSLNEHEKVLESAAPESE
jgi:hypothetical protein